MHAREDVPSNFDRLNAFVETGIARHLSKTAIVMYFAYLKRAGKDGLAWAKSEALMEECGGISMRSIPRARQELTTMGLLKENSDAKRGMATAYEVVVANIGMTKLAVQKIAVQSIAVQSLSLCPDTAGSLAPPIQCIEEQTPNRPHGASEESEPALPGAQPPTAPARPAPPAPPAPGAQPRLFGDPKPKRTTVQESGLGGAEYDMPKELDTPEFRRVWEEHKQYRRQRRDKPLTEIGKRRALGMLAKLGAPGAIAQIHKAEANNWQGLGLEGTNGNGRRHQEPTSAIRTVEDY
jgi:hypothetical protein